MESQNFGHEHPLILLNEEHSICNGSEEVECWRCEEKVSAPCFGCLESCGFYLHKSCAEAPLVIDHPFHRQHPLVLLQNSPYDSGTYSCNFCGGRGKKFVYHCPCEVDLHIKCALFTINIAENNLKELEHVTLQDGEEIKDFRYCFGCREPLSSYAYYSPDCGFNMHKKCVELPFEMNHQFHRKHALVLQFNADQLACKICPKRSIPGGFVYCCLLCKFVVHIECVLPPLIIEDKSHHPHTLTLFWARPSFICDTCGTGTEGGHVTYICAICNIIVHKKCISIPHVIKHRWHLKHRVLHKHFVQADDLKSRDCIMCDKEVNIEHGSYYCANCDIIFHVNCATERKEWYDIVSQENEDDIETNDVNSITIIETNDAGEATKVKHFLHMHNLMLSDKIEEDHKCCNGCMLPISASFYYCSVCNFFLHKDCAEMPKMMHYWLHFCKKPCFLVSNCIFRCATCAKLSNVFAYKCSECEDHFCLQCLSITPGAYRCLKHKHPLLFYHNYKGQCSGCGDDIIEVPAFRCKDCNFTIDFECLMLPIIARHKCDEHVLALTHRDDNDYLESHYCDICEERRDSRYWFYYCVTCDTSAHIKCVLNEYQCFKLGGTYKYEYHQQHPLTLVKKMHCYPSCMECGEPCEDLSLECLALGCNYIVHVNCIHFKNLKVVSALEESEDKGVIGQDT